ncbi:MAG TPA: outer membrane lipoprotein chaperone LolA [Vicinamibacterales bacterium]|nr:outer membrane lipoprotein chaperone LolA [Vicinamibacterales bacterium]
MPTIHVPLTILLSVGVAAGGQAPRSAIEVAEALQRRYDTVRDFSADFTHRHEGGVLRRKLVERGTLLVKKPGKMRWHYTTPEEKLFVSDGKQMSFHDVANDQVTISELPRGDQAATGALFLAGRGSLTRDFTVSFIGTSQADAYALKLEPKRKEAEYDWLEIVVDRASLQMRSLTAADRQGTRSTFEFSNVKENIGLADKTFAFTPPRGAELIYAGRPKR